MHKPSEHLALPLFNLHGLGAQKSAAFKKGKSIGQWVVLNKHLEQISDTRVLDGLNMFEPLDLVKFSLSFPLKASPMEIQMES